MEVEFSDPALQRLESDPAFTAGFDGAIVKVYRKRMQLIRAAVDERTFYAMTSLHYKKLQGDRDGQRSMRLNDQWRLILTLKTDETGKVVVIIAIEDYH
ncbi:MAG: type II toxin-antitoxin system RelE/ParE family toxin [Xanthomonadales bacterium]|nr:type II toxin-antitoxin system RelE/ParE family toxin [Xanthomonadales bacterium]